MLSFFPHVTTEPLTLHVPAPARPFFRTVTEKHLIPSVDKAAAAEHNGDICAKSPTQDVAILAGKIV